MKTADVNSSIYIDFGDHARISKYKNIFAKVCTPNW